MLLLHFVIFIDFSLFSSKDKFLMPGIKRKSTGKDGSRSSDGQSVISKFFKTTSANIKNEDSNNNAGRSSPRRKKKIVS